MERVKTLEARPGSFIDRSSEFSRPALLPVSEALASDARHSDTRYPIAAARREPIGRAAEARVELEILRSTGRTGMQRAPDHDLSSSPKQRAAARLQR